MWGKDFVGNVCMYRPILKLCVGAVKCLSIVGGNLLVSFS